MTRLPQLSDDIQYLRGIGPARAKRFAALGIHTVADLLLHYPRAYEDRTKLVQIAELEADVPACFRAMVMTTPRTSYIRKGLEITKLTVADHSARLNLVFFNQHFAAEKLQYGREYIFYGAVSGDFIGYQMRNPAVEGIDEAPLVTRRILPIYPLTAGLSNAAVARAIQTALETYGTVPELLPREVRQAYDILPAEAAYRAIHQPTDLQELEQAKKRLVFEEFFLFSVGLFLFRHMRRSETISAFSQTNLADFYDALPFRLTGAQNRAIDDILGDFQKGCPMNRLLQGDVGSGKTMVAAAAAVCASRNGFQTALMAPTEILAEQHYRSLGKLMAGLGIRCVLLTGSMSMAEKKRIRQEIASGTAMLAIGTHALLSAATEFRNLGLVITDEQHRFGVRQRSALAEKGRSPHLLVMSATPIPRTLALILYGDLDVSILDELPPGRQRVDTFLVNESYRSRLNEFLRKQVRLGHQCYIVCPNIEEGEENTGRAAQTWAQTLQGTIFPEFRVGLLHGRMKGTEKEAVMRAFAQGEIQILVSTTVIEVGVDVPNATVMVVEDADRFGLSQLHQLRGRVGRGSEKSWCILLSNNRSPETLNRLRTLCKTAEGFRIAEEDLQQRGPGDFFGERQHGLPTFRAANLCQDMALLRQAQQAAADWVDCHGTEDSAGALRARVLAMFQENAASWN